MEQKQIDKLAAEARREYQKKWRAANKDKVRRNNQLYWQRRAQRMTEEVKQCAD